MISDLISRKVLLEEINGPENKRCDGLMADWYANMVLRQPTAYNVDKVVERLEERIKNFKSLNSDDEIVDIAIKEIQRDIEIVKSGGVN